MQPTPSCRASARARPRLLAYRAARSIFIPAAIGFTAIGGVSAGAQEYELAIRFAGYTYRAHGLSSLGQAGDAAYGITGGRINTIDLLDARWATMAVEDSFWRPEGNGWMQRVDADRNYDESAKYASVFDVQYLNPFGASYSVPFGSYKGSQIIGLFTGKRALVRADLENPDGSPTGKWKDRVPGDLIELISSIRNVGRTIGWRFEPAGMLQAEVLVLETSKTTLPAPRDDRVNISCLYTQRFTYVGPNGIYTFTHEGVERPRSIFVADRGITEQPNPVCLAAIAAGVDITNFPTRYRSTIGGLTLDVRNPAQPLITAPNGTKEVMGSGAESAGFAQATQYEAIYEPVIANGPARSMRIQGRTFTSRIIDANNNLTRYRSTPNETIVEDAAGRVTRYLRDADGDVVKIEKDGPLGRGKLAWTLIWGSKSWDVTAVLGDITCPRRFESEERVPCAGLNTYKTLDALVLPDDRRYTFAYNLPDGRMSWGALTEVVTPDGAVERFDYGNGDTHTHALPLFERPDTYPEGHNRLAGRRVVGQTLFPSGRNGPSYSKLIEHERESSPTGGTPCRFIDWTRVWHTDRTTTENPKRYSTRTGVCSTGLAFDARAAVAQGRTMVEQTLDDSGRVLAATYSGNTGSLPISHASAPGEMFLEFELASDRDRAFHPIYLVADPRPTDSIGERDGLAWREAFKYDSSEIPAAYGKFRSYGNISSSTLFDATGAVVKQTDTLYHTGAAYLARNLVRLPVLTQVSGVSPQGSRLLSQTRLRYDEHGLEPSRDEQLDLTYAAAERGNVTSTVRDRLAPTDDTADEGLPPELLTTTRYFDNGTVREVTRPGERTTTVAAADFRGCSAADPIRETVTLAPDSGNASARHRSIERSDCFSGLLLAKLDANDVRSCAQYDALGRTIETAGPGDRLSALADGVRDPQCPVTSSTTLGSNGNGPSTWLEYRHLGRIGTVMGGADAVHQHTVQRTKNGMPGGRAVRSFSDGLGRVIQTCAQVDSATNPGAAEICTFKVPDDSGKTISESIPYSVAAGSEQVILPPPGRQYKYAVLDALGRPIYSELVGSGIAPTRTYYTVDQGAWVTGGYDPNGNHTVSGTNLLGQVFQVSRASGLCAGGYCSTVTVYDALGRVHSMTSPRNADGTGAHAIGYAYDGFGRRKWASDPSLGKQSFKHDDADNITGIRDAKGQTIAFTFDKLDRVLSKTMIDPTGLDRPAERVITYGYDGVGAPSTQNAKGRLTSVSNGLVATSVVYDPRGQTVRESMTADGRTFVQTYSYGFAKRPAQGEEIGDLPLAESRPDGEVVSYGYDADNALVSLTTRAPGGSPQPIITGVRRNVRGDLTEVALGNGTLNRYAYDEERSWRLIGRSVLAGRAPRADFQFGWDHNGNLTEVINRRVPYASWRYRYDSLDQLDLATTYEPRRTLSGNRGGRPINVGWTLAFGYSGTGNLRSKQVLTPTADTFTSESIEQRYGERGAGPYAVTSSAGDSLDYDANGNLVRSSADGRLRLDWNVENMPIATYRSERLITERWFLGTSLWKKVDTDSSGTVTATLYPAASVQVENGRFRHRYGEWAERDPIDGQLRFFHRDQIGSTTLVTDALGGVLYDALYQPFGEPLHVFAPYKPQRTWSGRERESISGLYDFGARLYSPRTGRWLSADSAIAGVLPDRLNRYHYASNSPTSRIDPDGHQDQKVAESGAVLRIETNCYDRNGRCYDYDPALWGAIVRGSRPAGVLDLTWNPRAPLFYGYKGNGRTVWVSVHETTGSGWRGFGALVPKTTPATIVTGIHGDELGRTSRFWPPAERFYWEDVGNHGAKPNVNIIDYWTRHKAAWRAIGSAPGDVICAWCFSERTVAVERVTGVDVWDRRFAKLAFGTKVAGTGLAVVGVAGATVDGYQKDGLKGAATEGGAAAVDAAFCSRFPTLCFVFGMTTLQWRAVKGGGSSEVF